MTINIYTVNCDWPDADIREEAISYLSETESGYPSSGNLETDVANATIIPCKYNDNGIEDGLTVLPSGFKLPDIPSDPTLLRICYEFI